MEAVQYLRFRDGCFERGVGAIHSWFSARCYSGGRSIRFVTCQSTNHSWGCGLDPLMPGLRTCDLVWGTHRWSGGWMGWPGCSTMRREGGAGAGVSPGELTARLDEEDRRRRGRSQGIWTRWASLGCARGGGRLEELGAVRIGIWD